MAAQRVPPPRVPPPARLTWLESPVQVSGMSHSFTASRQDTPRGSYCTGGMKPPRQDPTAQEPWQLTGSGHAGRRIQPPPHPGAAPCSLCSRARRCTWRRGSACTSCSSCPRSLRTPAGTAGGTARQPPGSAGSPGTAAARRARTPLTASEPQSHSSPASTKPLPHSGGSRSCREGGEGGSKRCRGGGSPSWVLPRTPPKRAPCPQGMAGPPPNHSLFAIRVWLCPSLGTQGLVPAWLPWRWQELGDGANPERPW